MKSRWSPRLQLRTGWPRVSLRCLRCARLAIEPRLRRREARETRNGGPQIDRFPLRVEAGSLQLFNPRKQGVDKAGDALRAVRFARPVEGDQRGRHGNRGHAFALFDQLGIVGRVESGWKSATWCGMNVFSTSRPRRLKISGPE